MARRVRIGGAQPSLSFYNATTGCTQSDIWKELENGLWRTYNAENRLYNDRIGETKQTEWKQVFDGMTPIMPGFYFDTSSKQMKEKIYVPQRVSASRDTFMRAAEEFFGQYRGKKIGVHLSGGLDSSLIICLLKQFGIPFSLVGLQSKRFEFRTEKKIQDLLSGHGADSVLIDMETYPFYSKLENTPKHQIPDSFIKMNEADGAVAQAFADMGVEIVFTGQGGDTLLAEGISEETYRKGFNVTNEFTFPWEEDFMYGPRGIELVSFFSAPAIIDQIVNLRANEREDPLKKWAREFFKDLLPRELSEFTYCADFFGHSMSGLHGARETIKMLFEEAYDVSRFDLFSPKNTRLLLEEDVFDFDYHQYTEYCTKISIAVWLHSLFREDE